MSLPQILQQDPSGNDDDVDCRAWENALSSHFTALSNVTKSLGHLAEEGDIFAGCLEICKSHADFSTKFIRKLMGWAQQANDILEGVSADLTPDALAQFIEDGSGKSHSLHRIQIVLLIKTNYSHSK